MAGRLISDSTRSLHSLRSGIKTISTASNQFIAAFLRYLVGNQWIYAGLLPFYQGLVGSVCQRMVASIAHSSNVAYAGKGG
jgi:hypothetical protein